MIQMKTATLPNDAQAHLDEKQAIIDTVPTYPEKVARGKGLWKGKSSGRGAPFFGKGGRIRKTLGDMCVGSTKRCNYCEDSAGDQIEHVRPQSLYPEKVFRWENYLFACGTCNREKNNKFAVFDANNRILEVSRKKNDPVVPPPTGQIVLINPRNENPMDYFLLDLETFLFYKHPQRSSKEQSRAKYSCKTLILNERDYLIEARKVAYITYLDSLKLYVSEKNSGATQAELGQKQAELAERPHPTVWYEMQRQRHVYPHLNNLFQQAPELLIPNNQL